MDTVDSVPIPFDSPSLDSFAKNKSLNRENSTNPTIGTTNRSRIFYVLLFINNQRKSTFISILKNIYYAF